MLRIPGSDTRPKLYLFFVLAVTAALLVPIWLVNYPGMVDYPNHLTRCYILSHYHQNADWQALYKVVKDPLPNLALELIVVPLNRFLPLLLCGKMFLTLAAMLYLGGCLWLGYALLGRLNWIAPIAALTFYNSALLFGFVNYCFGLGAFLCALAFWMQSRQHMSWPRFFLCSLFSLAAYLSHLSAIVFLAVSCSTIALLEWPRHRALLTLVRQLAWVATPLPVMLAFMHGNGQVGHITWPTLAGKAVQLLTPLRTYSIGFDAVIMALLILCGVFIARGSRIKSAAITAGVMFFLFLITPKVLFTSSAADARYVVPAFLLLVLSTDPQWTRTRQAALAVAALLMFLRTAEVAAKWVAIDHREQQVLQAGNVLPPHARVYVVQPSLPVSEKLDRGFFHVISLWTISHRSAVSILFLNPGQQPLVARQPVCNEEGPVQCAARYDYIWTDEPPPQTEGFVRSIADPVFAWENVRLWRVRHPLSAQGPATLTSTNQSATPQL